MDRTEWTVFDSAKEAEAYLADMYGDETDEDNGDEESEES
jgi:hypothetical protein